jgi:hypothetical protein
MTVGRVPGTEIALLGIEDNLTLMFREILICPAELARREVQQAGEFRDPGVPPHLCACVIGRLPDPVRGG